MYTFDSDFFRRDVLCVAPELTGRILVRRLEDGTVLRLRITEAEAYRGEADTACHASHGRTKRTETMYRAGGTLYLYLCYGIHWMLNIVTGPEDAPQAVLIRACSGADGPGKLTRALQLDGRFLGQSILTCPALRLEDDGARFRLETDTRVGIGYAAPEDQARLWRWKCGKQEV